MTTMEARLFVARFVSGVYSPGEHEAFLQWIGESPLDEHKAVIGAYEGLREQWSLGAGPSAEWIEQMERKLDLADEREKLMPPGKPASVRPVVWMQPNLKVDWEPDLKVKKMGRPMRRLAWIAAASVFVLLAGSGAYWYVNRSGQTQGSSDNKTETLSIMDVPRGQQGQLVLADGTKVWLNSASTLRYPASFAGQERVVELSGEALFEIAPNAGSPFQVRSGDLQVEVLGTRFNMRNYADESTSRVVLLEGSVKVIKGAETAVLQPGDLAETGYPSQANNIDAIRVTHGIDPQLALAWRDGYMRFDNDDLQTVMREIARRYNLEIKYEGKIPERHFTGKFYPNEDIHQILKILELQHIHFKIDGKIITVMP